MSTGLVSVLAAAASAVAAPVVSLVGDAAAPIPVPVPVPVPEGRAGGEMSAAAVAAVVAGCQCIDWATCLAADDAQLYMRAFARTVPRTATHAHHGVAASVCVCIYAHVCMGAGGCGCLHAKAAADGSMLSPTLLRPYVPNAYVPVSLFASLSLCPCIAGAKCVSSFVGTPCGGLHDILLCVYLLLLCDQGAVPGSPGRPVPVPSPPPTRLVDLAPYLAAVMARQEQLPPQRVPDAGWLRHALLHELASCSLESA
jgi:hypothetical protein